MRKMKVGILTMQRIFNYGSFLQAYALKNILEELGCEVEFADYHPGECLIKTTEKRGIFRKGQKVIEVFGMKASFRDKIHFIQYKRNYERQCYPLLGIEKDKMNYFPRLDVLVIGSDEVFNCIQKNSNVGYSRELFGFGSRASKVVAYAASFGNTTIEKIREYHISEPITEDLKRFEQISVRDKNSQKIVKELTGNIPAIHLDPVLLYNWKKDIPQGKPIKDKYMVVYGYSGRFSSEECTHIKEFARRHGLKIVCIGGIQNIENTFIKSTPFEVLQYFANAEYVVTDTFHGTILSMVMHRKFVTFVRSRGYGNQEKVMDLLVRLQNVQRKIVDLADLEKIMTAELDWLKIDCQLKEEKEKAYQYLWSILE